MVNDPSHLFSFYLFFKDQMESWTKYNYFDLYKMNYDYFLRRFHENQVIRVVSKETSQTPLNKQENNFMGYFKMMSNKSTWILR